MEKQGKIDLPLNGQPRIRQIGFSVHGRRRQETFVMDGLWGLHVYFWSGDVRFRGRRYGFHPNWASVTPPDTSLTWYFPRQRCEHYFAHFELTADKDELPVSLPIVRDLSDRIGAVCGRFDKAISAYPKNVVRAEVIIWDLLWDLADPAEWNRDSLDVQSTAVNTVVTVIENELRLCPTLKSISRRVGVSQNHLNNLFKRAHGTTVIEYLQQRRAERARHLLVESNLPVAVVADEIGMSDLQQFNKFIHRRLGGSPRLVRKRGRDPISDTQ